MFANAQRVEYSQTLPRYDIDCGADEAQRMLTTKSDDWAYEREYRLIARAGEADENNQVLSLVTWNNYLHINRQWLASVIAGCRCPVDELKALISKHAPGLAVKRAVMSTHSYRVITESA